MAISVACRYNVPQANQQTTGLVNIIEQTPYCNPLRFGGTQRSQLTFFASLQRCIPV